MEGHTYRSYQYNACETDGRWHPSMHPNPGLGSVAVEFLLNQLALSAAAADGMLFKAEIGDQRLPTDSSLWRLHLHVYRADDG